MRWKIPYFIIYCKIVKPELIATKRKQKKTLQSVKFYKITKHYKTVS